MDGDDSDDGNDNHDEHDDWDDWADYPLRMREKNKHNLGLRGVNKGLVMVGRLAIYVSHRCWDNSQKG